MAVITAPTLRLQADLARRPYGGGWWPNGEGVSHELLDLMHRWPTELPSIVRYSYISDDWDQSESTVPLSHRTRTLILVLSDRSTCRLLQLPADTPGEVAEELLAEASYSGSQWRRVDFVSTVREPTEPLAAGSGAADR